VDIQAKMDRDTGTLDEGKDIHKVALAPYFPLSVLLPLPESLVLRNCYLFPKSRRGRFLSLVFADRSRLRLQKFQTATDSAVKTQFVREDEVSFFPVQAE
jgi:hypothetical protein